MLIYSGSKKKYGHERQFKGWNLYLYLEEIDQKQIIVFQKGENDGTPLSFAVFFGNFYNFEYHVKHFV